MPNTFGCQTRRGPVRAALILGLLMSLNAGFSQDGETADKDRKDLSPVSENQVSHKHTNRLIHEKSPYLLQHAHNPVDWYPWGDEAFKKAKELNKPILLSIGYSTCHWCHVMERESFESEEVAKVMNEHFVAIKLDREERPDIDKIYMTAMQAAGMGGGWPLNVFLTPDRKPFYGGTYFPPKPAYGRPSFIQILERIGELWTSRQSDIQSQADELTENLQRMTDHEVNSDAILNRKMLETAAQAFKAEYEPNHGGFGRAPKFPRPSQPAFLFRYGKRYKDEEAIRMVLHTCDRMAAGGMYDQLGGGFARYSVDEKWLVPHFEKMLYDNAQLIHLYLDAYLISGEEKHAAVVRDILRYLFRDMTHPDGGFYSAEDADSEGHEGKFYAWTKKEMEEILSEDEARVAIRYFGVTEEGNFEDHSHPAPLKKQNVLSIVSPELTDSEAKLLTSAKGKMFEVQRKRVRPGLDDKVLASWNGLMLGAVARAFSVLEDPAYLVAAEKNIAFLKDKLWDANGKTLYHRWREGERDSAQLLDAYAYLLEGVIHLYEATLDPAHLQFAIDLSEAMIKRFYDEEEGGFFQSVKTDDLLFQMKEDYDGAEPSGNSVAILALLKLSAITANEDYKVMADKSLRLFSRKMQELPQATPYMLLALDYLLEEPKRVAIVGDPGSEDVKKLVHAAHAVYQPNKVVLGNRGPVEEFAKSLPAKEGKAQVFLCTGNACLPPTTEVAKVKSMLTDSKAF